MTFWSSETLVSRHSKDGIISPFDAAHVKHGAYQLTLGAEYYLTSDNPQIKKTLDGKGQISIPSGQFALLLTHEQVKIPNDTIGFISIRAGYKLRGLINVSGFHVDPGFHGRIKFGVYNAGAQPVVIDAGAQMFSIWFAKLSEPTSDLYDGKWQDQEHISDVDVMKLQGKVSSPGQIRKELVDLQGKVSLLQKWIISLSAAIVAGVIAIATWTITQAASNSLEGSRDTYQGSAEQDQNQGDEVKPPETQPSKNPNADEIDGE